MPSYESLPAESEFFNGNLFQKMVNDLRLAGKAKRTVYGYLRAICGLADFCQKSPDQLFEQDVRKYLLHLIVELEVATGTQAVALSGIKFFFRTTCPRDWKRRLVSNQRACAGLLKVWRCGILGLHNFCAAFLLFKTESPP